MKRTTISLPDRLAGVLEREAQRRRMSVSEVVRMALESHFDLDKSREPPAANLYHSGDSTAAADLEEILATQWPQAIDGDGLGPDR